MLSVLSLFAGIGGFDLGLARTGGFKTVAFAEIDPFCRAVLAKHWPEVPCYDDVRTLDAARLVRDGIGPVDVVCGGFPCQGVSIAGRGAGLDDPRSGLWTEMSRIIGECRPRWVIAENSPRLRTRGADRVLMDLEAHGYACWPFVVGAAHAGAPHRRGRAWILAYAGRQHGDRGQDVRAGHGLADRGGPTDGTQAYRDPERSGALLANANGLREPQPGRGLAEQRGRACDCGCESGLLDDALCGRHAPPEGPVRAGRHAPVNAGWWAAEPGVGRVAHGVPGRAHRLAALGNAVVPAIPEAIGRAILTAEHATPAACQGHGGVVSSSAVRLSRATGQRLTGDVPWVEQLGTEQAFVR